MKKKSFLLLGLLFFITFNPIFAHKPIQSDGTNTSFQNALEIPNHKISWAIYEEIKPFEAKFYSFEANAGDSFYTSIVIPKLERLDSFQPSLGLSGAGIEIQSTRIDAQLPEGGIIVYDYEGPIPSEEFYEPFGQATYWERQEIKITIPYDGIYYIVVYNGQGFEGKYSLAVGTIENFSLLDLFLILPTAWLDTKFFFEDYTSVAIFFAILLGIPFTVLVKKRKIILSTLPKNPLN
jgi:hypothetical protein